MFKPLALTALALAVITSVALPGAGFAEETSGKNTTETTTAESPSKTSRVLAAPGALVKGTYNGGKKVAVGTKNGVGKVFRLGRKKSTPVEENTNTPSNQ